jgi:hypothetical protein
VISSRPQPLTVEDLVSWISMRFLKMGPSVTNVWNSPLSPQRSMFPSFLRSLKKLRSRVLPSHSMPSNSFFTRTTVALKPSLMNSSRTSVVSRCQSGRTGVKPISLVILSSHPASCSATSKMSPVMMPSAPFFFAFCSAFLKSASYVWGVVGIFTMGIPMASDCASRSWLLIMWKLLVFLSCIIMSRFWTWCPSWMALWSANALSFPPLHEAMTFMFSFSLLFRCPKLTFSWVAGFRCGWFIQRFHISIVMKG